MYYLFVQLVTLRKFVKQVSETVTLNNFLLLTFFQSQRRCVNIYRKTSIAWNYHVIFIFNYVRKIPFFNVLADKNELRYKFSKQLLRLHFNSDLHYSCCSTLQVAEINVPCNTGLKRFHFLSRKEGEREIGSSINLFFFVIKKKKDVGQSLFWFWRFHGGEISVDTQINWLVKKLCPRQCALYNHVHDFISNYMTLSLIKHYLRNNFFE